MDVKAPTDERCSLRTTKPCGPGAPRSGAKFATMRFTHRAGDGGKRDGSPRRARNKSSTTAQGRPVVTACTCGHRALAQPFLRGGPGCSGHPVFPAPSVFREGDE